MQNPMILANWPDRTAYDIYLQAVREALTHPDIRVRSRLLAEAADAWDRSLALDARLAS